MARLRSLAHKAGSLGMPIRSHTELIVWRKAVDLVEIVYDLTRSFPSDERFGLVSQLRRAAVSVPANIAEGHGRMTRGEFLNQLSVARGSLNEIATLFTVSERLGFADAEALAGASHHADEVGRMLTSMQRRLREQRHK